MNRRFLAFAALALATALPALASEKTGAASPSPTGNPGGAKGAIGTTGPMTVAPVIKVTYATVSATGDMGVVKSATVMKVDNFHWGTYKDEAGPPSGTYTFMLTRTSDGNAIVDPPVEVKVYVNGVRYNPGQVLKSDAARAYQPAEAPAAPPAEPPKPVSRRELFDMFRRPLGGGKKPGA